jgi:hypothetical protein
MPPRFVYWTIIAGGLPTAFRAAEREDLLPTFHRIKERQPDAQMKYFARGKLWESQDEARRAAEERRRAPKPAARRGRDWRPGGEHRDPRQDFKDAKADRNLRARKRRFEKRTEGDPAKTSGPKRPAKPYGSARPARPRGRAPFKRSR